MHDPGPHLFPFGILGPGDPSPLIHERRGLSPILLACDHAHNCVPSGVPLGVLDADLARHIGIDIGALGVARRLSERFDSELIGQRYSRLVIDCNRPPSEASAFPARVDGTDVPGNRHLTAREAAARVAEIFHPYHAALAAALDRRRDAGVETILLSVHSFTPAHSDFPGARPWHVSVLFDKDPSFSLALAAELRTDGTIVGENVPYRVGALGDYTIPVHAEPRKIPHTLLEIRQDLIGDAAGEAHWAERLARALEAVCSQLRELEGMV